MNDVLVETDRTGTRPVHKHQKRQTLLNKALTL